MGLFVFACPMLFCLFFVDGVVTAYIQAAENNKQRRVFREMLWKILPSNNIDAHGMAWYGHGMGQAKDRMRLRGEWLGSVGCA